MSGFSQTCLRYIRALILGLAVGLVYVSCSAQSYTYEEMNLGYAVRDTFVHFIFSPLIYGTDPQKVVVTGSFRSWDQNMSDENWMLRPDGDLFTLILRDPSKWLSPNDEFKYRINDGEWMSPPSEAINEKGGNLVYMKTAITMGLKAELINSQTIWAEVIGERSLDPGDYKLTDAWGREVAIAEVLPNDANQTLIGTAFPIDQRRVYFLEIPKLGLRTACRYDGWFRTLYSPKKLGANIENGHTSVRVFAPRAEKVKLYLYKGKDDKDPFASFDMFIDEQGVWEKTIEEDLHGIYYDFTVHGSDDPGNHFYGTNPVHVTDPYARVSDNSWGKGRIWRATKPASPLEKGIPKMEDVIAYEVHVQDFTDLLPIERRYKGTLAAMGIEGLRNSRGEKIGFDYLLDLGINTVHLMPVQEYLHFPDDDWKASFNDDPYMIEQGISEENYQWGYRTTHAFAVESKYRVKGAEPGEEREQFRDLVQKFHDHGLAVIIDIVPNHTGENMDANEFFFNFNAFDKQYYYRTKSFEHIGAYGNEVKTENRPMVQRWLIDQCLHFIEEFGIDGFRIDLAGQIDRQSLTKLKDAIGHDKILYGEAWIGSNDPEYENNPDWDWYKHNSPITFFQDDSRNAFKGPVFELKDKFKDRGWPGGLYGDRSKVMMGLANKFPDDKTPVSGINYLDIHDNFALADQFATEGFDGRLAVDQDLYKIAVTLLYTSLGPIVTHGGSEIMRSKAAAPLKEVEKQTMAGYKIYLHGKRDTYNHRAANRFIWESVGAKPSGDNKNDYQNMHAFWRGMNRFRLSNYGKVFRKSVAVGDDYYRWILPSKESALGYIVDNKILVLLNAGHDSVRFGPFSIPPGDWHLIATNDKVDHINGVVDTDSPQIVKGGQKMSFDSKAESLRIWVKKKD